MQKKYANDSNKIDPINTSKHKKTLSSLSEKEFKNQKEKIKEIKTTNDEINTKINNNSNTNLKKLL